MTYDNLRELCEWRTRLTPDDVFMSFYGDHISFRQLDRRANQTAHALLGLGVKKGDVVNIHLFNRPEHFICCMAAFKIGAVACPVNSQFTPKELSYQVNDSRGVVLVTESSLAEVSSAVRDELGTIRQVLEIGDDVRPEHLDFHEATADEKAGPASIDIESGDEAVIIYTSGTTGRPKGAVLTHGNFVYMVKAVHQALFGSQAESERLVMLVCLPMFHVNPLMHNLMALDAGHRIVLMRKFSVREFGPLVETERPTYFFGVPKMYKVLLEARDTVRTHDLGSLTFGGCGAAPMPAETIFEFEKAFGFELLEGYGLTECTFASTIHRRGGVKKIGSVGQAMEGQEVLIVDPDGNPVGANETGEIIIGGPGVMKAYFGKAAETNEVLRDGWLHTGDIGRVDDDGFYYIVDRIKDMIIKGGENIYPKEIEDVISELPEVHDVGVIGIPDPISGEEVKAFVVPRLGRELAAEEVLAHCRSRLAEYKIPKEVEFLLGLPANATGKTLKRELRDGGGLIRMNEQVEAIPLDLVWAGIAGRFKPEKAGDWKAKITYEVFGRSSGAVTFVIQDGRIEPREGRDPESTVTVKMTDAALMRIIEGRLDMLAGINSGLIQVDGSEADLTMFGEVIS
ncbi:MAG: long-chain-fatty-acid--CoA ligase [Proteobacteria bacterium]|nr:long-chain-fatty-acid--CoA ligase [Pseudomonadota bacterium]